MNEYASECNGNYLYLTSQLLQNKPFSLLLMWEGVFFNQIFIVESLNVIEGGINTNLGHQPDF